MWAWRAELVKCEEQYEGVVRSLLGRTAVAEDLDYAVTMARKYGYRFRVVTLGRPGGQCRRFPHWRIACEEWRACCPGGRRSTPFSRRHRPCGIKRRPRRKSCAPPSRRLPPWRRSSPGAKGELATAQEDGIRFEAELRRLREQEEAAEKAVAEYAGEIETLSARAEECRALKAQAEEEAAGVQKEKEEAEAELSASTNGRQELSGRPGGAVRPAGGEQTGGPLPAQGDRGPPVSGAGVPGPAGGCRRTGRGMAGTNYGFR